MNHNKQNILTTGTSLLVALILCLSACKETPSKGVATQPFTVPTPPAMLTDPAQRAEYVATHYWEHFNFTDTTLIRRAEITEQAFADFISIIAGTPQSVVEKSIATMLTRAVADSAMYAHFTELSEKYLYDPNSPLRNEEIYIVVLQNIIANPALDDIQKVRPRYQLDLALRNRVGMTATDFTYTTAAGATRRLHQAKGNRILLFFFEPGCLDCKRVKEHIATHSITDKATIVMVNPDEVDGINTLYDVRARPLLYLLDKDKKVILKDAPIEQIGSYLSN